MEESAQKEAQLRTLKKTLRFSGVAVFLVGAAVLFDFNGTAAAIGMADPATRNIFGAVACLFGVFEGLILPSLLDKKQS